MAISAVYMSRKLSHSYMSLLQEPASRTDSSSRADLEQIWLLMVVLQPFERSPHSAPCHVASSRHCSVTLSDSPFPRSPSFTAGFTLFCTLLSSARFCDLLLFLKF